jgi:hypothetical protein
MDALQHHRHRDAEAEQADIEPPAMHALVMQDDGQQVGAVRREAGGAHP